MFRLIDPSEPHGLRRLNNLRVVASVMLLACMLCSLSEVNRPAEVAIALGNVLLGLSLGLSAGKLRPALLFVSAAAIAVTLRMVAVGSTPGTFAIAAAVACAAFAMSSRNLEWIRADRVRHFVEASSVALPLTLSLVFGACALAGTDPIGMQIAVGSCCVAIGLAARSTWTKLTVLAISALLIGACFNHVRSGADIGVYLIAVAAATVGATIAFNALPRGAAWLWGKRAYTMVVFVVLAYCIVCMWTGKQEQFAAIGGSGGVVACSIMSLNFREKNRMWSLFVLLSSMVLAACISQTSGDWLVFLNYTLAGAVGISIVSTSIRSRVMVAVFGAGLMAGVVLLLVDTLRATSSTQLAMAVMNLPICLTNSLLAFASSGTTPWLRRDGVRQGETLQDDMWFMVGIECTQIVDVRPNMRELDEFALLQHYERWADDLELITKLRHGDRRVVKVRWALPWYRCEPERGVYDWSWTDKVIDRAVQLGLELVPDIVHYGCPRWMPDSFLDPEYPERVASFARAAAERYEGKVHNWTPFNEPAVTAEFCGMRGEWPPYEKSESAYCRILASIARGMQLTISALREVDPTATIWAAESTKNYHPLNEAAVPHCQVAFHRDLVVWDLVHGKVTAEHERYDWLIANGVTVEQLAGLTANPQTLDILGLNFYPWLSQTYEWKNGRIVQDWDWNGTLLIELLREAYDYTGAKLCLTETSAHGGGGAKSQSAIDNCPDFRIRWMDETIWAMEQARREDIPVLGYTQFPLFTMVDWKYRMEPGTVQDYFVHFGMIEVDAKTYERQWTSVADRFLYHMEHFPFPGEEEACC